MSGRRVSRGRRFEDNPKLNYKKVFAVIIAVVVIILFIISLKNILTKDVFDNKNAGYYAVYTEEKWGVIDSKGEIVIPPSYAEMIIIPDNKQDVFLCTYDIDGQTGEYKTKALNKKGEEIFKEYEKIEAIENYDLGQNIWYEKDILKVMKNGKYGLIDYKESEILKCEYDDIYALKGIENSFIVSKDNKLGLVDKTGRTVINTEFTNIMNLGKNYTDGYITIDENNKYGVISYAGETKLPNSYDKVEQTYGKDSFVVIQNGKEKLINSSGDVLVEDGYDDIVKILTKNEGIIYKKGNAYGIMNQTGETLIDAKYEDMYELDNGYIVAKKDGQYGIIDINDDIKLYFDYLSINYNKDQNVYIAEDVDYKSSIVNSNFEVKLIGILSEFNQEKGYIRMRIENEYKYYNFNYEEKKNTEILVANTLFLSKKDDKYGYVNSNGEVVVDYIYDDATEQNKYGYVAVKKNGMWGSLDSKGKKVVDTKYKLDDNLIIDFIGKWHLGQDLNMNYYCN